MSNHRVLFLTGNLAGVEAFGAQLRTKHTLKALRKIAEVRVVSLQNEVSETRRSSPGKAYDEAVSVKELPTKGLRSKLRFWLDPGCTELHGGLVISEDRKRIFSRLADYDAIWFHNIRTANLFGRWHWPHSVMDLDDIPSAYERAAFSPGSGLPLMERLKAGLRMLAAKRREQRLDERFTVVSVCSDADRQYLAGLKHVHVIPNGFERPAEEPQYQPASLPRIGFIGLFNFFPNLDGVRWFVRECWEDIQKKVPGVRLRLVGKETDGPLKPEAEGIDGLGWLADPAAEIASWSMMVVPIRLGAGTRVKIADGLSRKCPMVATPLGAFGYGLEDRRELRLADTPSAFSAACVEVIQNPAEARAMAERGWKVFSEQHTWEAIEPRVWAAAEDCWRHSSGQSALA